MQPRRENSLKAPSGGMTKQPTTGSAVAVKCPACGHAFSDAEEAQVQAALAGAPEPTSMLEAMNQELDDPVRQKEREMRKE